LKYILSNRVFNLLRYDIKLALPTFFLLRRFINFFNYLLLLFSSWFDFNSFFFFFFPIFLDTFLFLFKNLLFIFFFILFLRILFAHWLKFRVCFVFFQAFCIYFRIFHWCLICLSSEKPFITNSWAYLFCHGFFRARKLPLVVFIA